MNEKLIIAIDGPAGSGKSTVAKRIAKRLGILYVDTGAMYRALTLKAIKEEIDLSDESQLTELIDKTSIELNIDKDFKLSVLLDREDVSGEIRKQYVTNNVKYLACLPGVRKRMALLQRKAASGGRAVLEGRDIGTVVFPDAELKVFLDASVEERSKRRFKELKDENITIEKIKNDVQTRDQSDVSRSVAPLKKADDAIYIDTTGLSIEEVTERIIKKIESI